MSNRLPLLYHPRRPSLLRTRSASDSDNMGRKTEQVDWEEDGEQVGRTVPGCTVARPGGRAVDLSFFKTGTKPNPAQQRRGWWVSWLNVGTRIIFFPSLRILFFPSLRISLLGRRFRPKHQMWCFGFLGWCFRPMKLYHS
jgi:hypothetical protein